MATRGNQARRADAGSGRRADHLPAARLARPGAGTEPAAHSAEHLWFVILRMYRPQPAVIEAKWECPDLTPVT